MVPFSCKGSGPDLDVAKPCTFEQAIHLVRIINRAVLTNSRISRIRASSGPVELLSPDLNTRKPWINCPGSETNAAATPKHSGTFLQTSKGARQVEQDEHENGDIKEVRPQRDLLGISRSEKRAVNSLCTSQHTLSSIDAKYVGVRRVLTQVR
jgi:hypothetical protein